MLEIFACWGCRSILELVEYKATHSGNSKTLIRAHNWRYLKWWQEQSPYHYFWGVTSRNNANTRSSSVPRCLKRVQATSTKPANFKPLLHLNHRKFVTNCGSFRKYYKRYLFLNGVDLVSVIQHIMRYCELLKKITKISNFIFFKCLYLMICKND